MIPLFGKCASAMSRKGFSVLLVWRFVASLKVLWIILMVTAALALFEQHQGEQGHLQPRTHPRGHPQLAGPSLEQLADVLLHLYPAGAEPNFLMGKALVDVGKLQEARPYFERAMKIERRNLNLLFLYARLLLDLGEEPERVKGVVDEIRRYYPRSRQEVETYFGKASKGKIRFEEAAY
jgi:hypothetical protein